jgi:mRNA interferase HigB
MNIISKKPLRIFWDRHADSVNALGSWYRIAKKARWQSLADVRQDFSHADLAGVCTVFNIGGNKYRLIVKISYRTQKIFVRAVLTHAEYDKGIYKKDCES